MAKNDKIRLGDILWEYADFAPPPAKPSSLAPKAPERRTGLRTPAPRPAPAKVQDPKPDAGDPAPAGKPPAPPGKAPSVPKASPKAAPKDTPKASPKAVPKAAPKASPKAAPKHMPETAAEPVYDSSLESTLTYSVGAFVQEELAKAAPPPPPSQIPEPSDKAEKVKALLDRVTKPASQQEPAAPAEDTPGPVPEPPAPEPSAPPEAAADETETEEVPSPPQEEQPEEEEDGPELLIDFDDGEEPGAEEEAAFPEDEPLPEEKSDPELLTFPSQGRQAQPQPGAAGTADQPAQPSAPAGKSWRERQARAQAQPQPDASPSELAEEYGEALHGLAARTILTFVLAGLLLLLTFSQSDILPVLADLVPAPLLLPAGLVMLGLCGVFAAEVLEEGVKHLIRGAPDGDTLAVFATLFTVVDAATLLALELRSNELPFFAPCALVLAFHLLGHYCMTSARHQASKTAASVPQPYVVTKDQDILRGQSAFRKWIGTPKGFGSQLRSEGAGSQRFQRLTPVLLVACAALALVTTAGHHQPRLAFWSLSAMFTAASTLGCCLTLSLPWRLLSKRHARLGVALAGGPGVTESRRCRLTTMGDYDLYPPGSVSFGAVKAYGSTPMERMVSLAASVVRVSSSGLVYPFHRLLQSYQGNYVPVERLLMQPGGLMGQIGGMQVYVGNTGLISRLGLAPPPDVKAKDSIFCAVDGELIGSFTLRYNLHPAILPSMRALFAHRMNPVLITRDFNLTPHRLRLSGKLPAKRINFPNLQHRFQLSGPGQPHGSAIVAVLCREGLPPLAHALISARRTGLAQNISSIMVCVSACVGVVLTAALSSAGAVASLTAWTLSLYLLLWMTPVLLLSLWVCQY